MPRMKGWVECWDEDTIQRKAIDRSKLCDFGIKCLDDAFIGILRNDLVVLGADSGVGKSDICLNMALHNASKGKQVALFFIEGGAGEAIARIKWKAIKDVYYAGKFTEIDLDYRKWRMGLLECDLMDRLELQAQVELDTKIGDKLHIYDFDADFKIDNLVGALGYYATKRENEYKFEEYFYDIDLIIIDHLQYFTLTNPKQELIEMTQILMKVKEITNFHKIPVILVSHLRKKDKDRGLPSQDDFYGTSNICKISSMAITITNHPTGDKHSEEIFPTFFRVVKSRTGIRSTYGILCNYNFKLSKYESDYKLYALASDKPISEPMELAHLPKWAKPSYKPKKLEEWIKKEE